MTRPSIHAIKSRKDNAGRPHFLFLGHTGFPIGFGGIQRTLLIAKGMIANGAEATVISYKGVHSDAHSFPSAGKYEGVNYRYTSGTIYRPAGFWKRNWLKVSGKAKELLYIRQLRKTGELGGCLISTAYFGELLLYWIWFKMQGIPLVLNYDELNSARPSRQGISNKVNDYLFDYFGLKLVDKSTPISDYLIDHVRSVAPGKPILKLPILCDFEKFGRPKGKKEGEVHFVYCGAASYLPLIRFVMKAFELLESGSQKIYLDLILGGKDEELKRVKEIASGLSRRERVTIFPNVPHHLIPSYYAKASALLIPLRPTVQDAARFPHKLGEYLASGNPVVTTAFGEIRHYEFVDGRTALVADSYSPASFARKMQYVVDHSQEAQQIGALGRKMGLDNFNYKDIGLRVKDFILNHE